MIYENYMITDIPKGFEYISILKDKLGVQMEHWNNVDDILDGSYKRCIHTVAHDKKFYCGVIDIKEDIKKYNIETIVTYEEFVNDETKPAEYNQDEGWKF